MSTSGMTEEDHQKLRSHKEKAARRQQAELASKDGGTGVEEASDSSTTDMASLAVEITKTVADMMDQKLSEFSSKLDTITAKFEQNSQCITEAENCISNAEDITAGLESRLSDTKNKLIALTHQVIDADTRGRRDNLKIFEVKSGIEGKDPVSFFETWLAKILNIKFKKGRIRLDRCHRSLSQPK